MRWFKGALSAADHRTRCPPPLATPPNPAPLQTEAAADRLKELLATKPEALGIRVGLKTRAFLARAAGVVVASNSRAPPPLLTPHLPLLPPVRAGGCNGQSYTITYAKDRKGTDEEVDCRGIRVFIEPGALMKVVGTSMDWRETDLASEFVFENPNAKSVCGCGESFSTS